MGVMILFLIVSLYFMAKSFKKLDPVELAKSQNNCPPHKWVWTEGVGHKCGLCGSRAGHLSSDKGEF